MNIKYVATLFLTVALPCVAVAQGSGVYECVLGDQVRRVEILSEPGMSVPCEVHYYKDKNAPDEKQVLWSAMNETGYCESKTETFIAKLEGWGWECASGEEALPSPESDIDTNADAEAPVVDTTDDLQPVTDLDAQ